jgi:hypothetical protein
MANLPEDIRKAIAAPREEPKLWHADPHKYGHGKIHIIDRDNSDKTYCGQLLKACPGGPAKTTMATCKICLNAVVRRQEAAVREQERQDNTRILREEQEQKRNQRKAEYQQYLQTAEWKNKSQTVLKRANFLCEGCGSNRATQAHHITYEHVFNEFLWELKAVCRSCHERAHLNRVFS